MPRILVIDDSDLLRRIYAYTLKRYEIDDFDVGFAANGREGIDYLDQYEVDVVLLDLDMPVMNGFQFLRIVRGDPRYKALPVLIVSSLDDPHQIARGLKAGATGYLTKPFERDELYALIDRVLERRIRKKT